MDQYKALQFQKTRIAWLASGEKNLILRFSHFYTAHKYNRRTDIMAIALISRFDATGRAE